MPVRAYVIMPTAQDPASTFVVGEYEDYTDKIAYQDYMIVFPYPSVQITKSDGKLNRILIMIDIFSEEDKYKKDLIAIGLICRGWYFRVLILADISSFSFICKGYS